MVIGSILSFDMTTGKLACPGYMLLSWRDEEIIWNASDFSGVSRLTLSSEDIWTPKFVQWGGQMMDISLTLTSAFVYSNGTVFWMIGSLFEGSCELDMRRYPLDSHTCQFFLQPSASDASDIELTIGTRSDEGMFAEHGEWEITGSSDRIFTFIEPLTGQRHIALLKTLTLSRRALFTMIHTWLPIFLLALLNIMIFLVPLKSGERITFSVTVLLTFVVFTSNIGEELPHTSLTVSLPSIYMATINCITTMTVIISVILCRMAHEKIVPVPNVLVQPTRKFIKFKLRKCCKQKPKETVVEPFSTTDENKNGQEIPKVHLETADDEDDIEVNWEVVANMLDFIFFYMNLTVVILTNIIIASLFATLQ